MSAGNEQPNFLCSLPSVCATVAFAWQCVRVVGVDEQKRERTKERAGGCAQSTQVLTIRAEE